MGFVLNQAFLVALPLRFLAGGFLISFISVAMTASLLNM